VNLFAGFHERRISVEGVGYFALTGGSGPPLLLLHGFPQTHAMWHAVAPALAARFSLVIPDLKGYGRSAAPESGAEGYAKRTMARELVALMAALGHDRYAVAGHDRGGRVAYRMALDHPQRVIRLAVLDIVPTAAMWAAMAGDFAVKVYHWPFLAQPAPLPERMIAADPEFYLDWTLQHWTASRDLSGYDPRALADYRASFSQPARIHAACNDYRAGATFDRQHDEDDLAAGRAIDCPVLVLWGAGGLPAEQQKGEDPERHPLTVWRRYARDVRGAPIPCGHFLPEEAPRETEAALVAFFGEPA
jgi:haloacetate dehalogenase